MKKFWRDDDGTFAVIAGLLLPVLIAGAVLATEVGNWAYRHEQMQGAADAAALSAVISKLANASTSATTAQGQAVAAASGFVQGVDGVTVVVNSPPSSGPNASRTDAVEVIIQRSYVPSLAKFISNNSVTVRARAVARHVTGGGACVLSLDNNANKAVELQGSAVVTLNGCNAATNSSSASGLYAWGSSSLTVAKAVSAGGIVGDDRINASSGLVRGSTALADPYASLSYPTYNSSTAQAFPANGTIYPGVWTGPIQGAITMSPGIYYVDAGTFTLNGSGSIYGRGVTIVLANITGALKPNNNPAIINGNSPVDLTAPTDGPTAGIVLFGDRSMKTNLTINGGSTQNWGGAIYMPGVDLTFVGGASGTTGCTQIVTKTVSFSGTSNLSLNCGGTAVKPITNQTAELVE